jgi:phosphotransferase system IIA component
VSLTHFAPYHFATGFNRYFYQEHLGELGFQIDTVSPNGNFFKLVAQELKRVKQVAIEHSQDRPNLIEKCCTKVVLSMLDRFSRKDNSSSELACFGMQIVATKTACTASRAA